MSVSVRDGKGVLPAERRHPNVVGKDGGASRFELTTKLGIPDGSLLTDLGHIANRKHVPSQRSYSCQCRESAIPRDSVLRVAGYFVSNPSGWGFAGPKRLGSPGVNRHLAMASAIIKRCVTLRFAGIPRCPDCLDSGVKREKGPPCRRSPGWRKQFRLGDRRFPVIIRRGRTIR